MIGTLRRSLSDGDAEAFRRTAHSLKSNALTFGAAGLAERAKALEHGGLAQARIAHGAIDELDGEYRRVVLALKEIVGE
jgi:HPt (histidine-containing phosphotransfer) domain-containing protein